MASVLNAVRNGDAEEFKRLMQMGKEVNIADSQGRTALHYACESGKIDDISLLIDRGANVNHANKVPMSQMSIRNAPYFTGPYCHILREV